MARRTILIIVILSVAAVAALLVLGLFVRHKIQEREARKQYYLDEQRKKAQEQTITIIEGWTEEDIARYLEQQGVGTSLDFQKAIQIFPRAEDSFLADLPKQASLEGFLFPDTYRLPKPATSEQILTKLLGNFSDKWVEAHTGPGADVHGLTPFQLVTLASIVEKETGNSLEERKTIAGIFYNRLKAGMPLESDATLNYITKSGRAQASDADLKLNSPYNTYKHRGLPPGPISNPSLSSLIAVLHANKTDYLYFLHDQKTGQVYYAKTFDQHLQNKFKYLK